MKNLKTPTVEELMEFSPEELKEFLKPRLRTFFITFDEVVRIAVNRGKFAQKAFDPLAGKIDPYDPFNFNCDPKLLKSERIKEFTLRALIESSKREHKGESHNAKTIQAIGDLMDTLCSDIYVAIDKSYHSNPQASYSKFVLFSFFQLHMPDTYEGLLKVCDEDTAEIAMKLLVNQDLKGGVMTEREFQEMIPDKEFLKIAANRELCTGTVMFDYSDDLIRVSSYLEYEPMAGYLKCVDSVQKVFEKVTLTYGNRYNNRQVDLKEVMGIEESSINLLDI